jgi:hypothetical protein
MKMIQRSSKDHREINYNSLLYEGRQERRVYNGNSVREIGTTVNKKTKESPNYLHPGNAK